MIMCLNSVWEVYQCHKLVVWTRAFAFKAMKTIKYWRGKNECPLIWARTNLKSGAQNCLTKCGKINTMWGYFIAPPLEFILVKRVYSCSLDVKCMKFISTVYFSVLSVYLKMISCKTYSSIFVCIVWVNVADEKYLIVYWLWDTA